ncbi:Protein O-mannosyl-transferase 2 [Hypsibius exemplaris]|uniref:Protein O-mannosyl-transferase 2 n=1 Tax=Hypsibius exemplaris TaxID=2072580 RepID=A0A9X6NJ06_HYPEX|nr:Protein O-mannosyl-transferase 2 [Hypsibius exemplaris]
MKLEAERPSEYPATAIPLALRKRRESLTKISFTICLPDLNKIDCKRLALCVLTVLGFLTRFYKIELPRKVCWDETHHGKMASWYFDRTFFFDVHPPLGRMSLALAGYLTGFDGKYQYNKAGDQIPEDAHTEGMRQYCALLGVLMIPLAFDVVFTLTSSTSAGLLGGALVLFDTGTAVITRHVLLDAPLMFFGLATVWANVRSWRYDIDDNPFKWWQWKIITGIMLGSVLSVKFVGVFAFLWVGITTIQDLLQLWSNPARYSLVYIIKMVAYLAACLLIVPGIMYVSFFYIHLSLVKFTGSGDGFYSSDFQSTLIGNPLHNKSSATQMAFASNITIKSTYGNGAYLHSHPFSYPGNRQHQQVTCYSHKDGFNDWTILDARARDCVQPERCNALIRHNDYVVLLHKETNSNLRIWRVAAPSISSHYRVGAQAVGNESNINDTDDVWRIELSEGFKIDRIRPVHTKFRLRHNNTGCLLQSTRTELPTWGHNQFEVTCNTEPKLADDLSQLFNIEDLEHSALPQSRIVIKYGFWKKFVESHHVMLRGNNGFKPKKWEQKVSRAWHWPINYMGQSFSGDDFVVYLICNPAVCALNLIGFLAYLLLEIYVGFTKKRSSDGELESYHTVDQQLNACRLMVLVYFLHYGPFLLMNRVVYFHHYFPALLFGCIQTALTFSCWTEVANRKGLDENRATYLSLMNIVILVILSFTFYLFSPLIYGHQAGLLGDFPVSHFDHLKLMDKWDFHPPKQ